MEKKKTRRDRKEDRWERKREKIRKECGIGRKTEDRNGEKEEKVG